MADKMPFTLQDLYKTLKKHDADILKHFNDDDLSDYDYLFYAINSDIFSSALNIVMNILAKNETTLGIDNNARAIIEGFVILKMLASGNISEVQLKIFRSHFAIVDYDNFKKWIKQDTNHPAYVEMQKRYDDAVDFLTNYYNCTRKALRGHFVFVDDPLFYLKSSLQEDISFATLLNKYPIFNEHSLRIYEFYSIMIHPRYIDSDQLEKSIQHLKKQYTNVVLDYVVDYLKAGKLLIIDDKLPTFDDDFKNNSVLLNNNLNIMQVDIAFEMLKEELCVLKDGCDAFTMFFFDMICPLIKDMMICESLGFNEQVISKFKSFMEIAAVDATINCVDDIEEFKILKNAFAFSSKLQLEEHIKSMNLGGEKFEIVGLKEIYEKYYKPKYDIASYEEFEKKMRNNSLYFLNPNEDKNYNRYVTNAINEIFTDEYMRGELYSMYKLAKDMNHASGYNFNSSPGITEYHSHVVMHAVFVWILNLILNASAVVAENDHEPKNIKPIVDFFKALIEFESKSMSIIGKKYEEDYNKFSNQ